MWPRWLPEHARLPLVAQITGAVALTALIVAPWWSSIPRPTPLDATPVRPSVAVPHAPVVAASKPITGLDDQARASVSAGTRPAHLNLDVRHSFSSVALSVTVDGKPALHTKLDGSGKRFKMFGKRADRSYTQSLDLSPGVRVVRVRLQSPVDKFDQTRVERFELAAASVAAIRIAADKSGMSLVANHPASPSAPKAPPSVIHAGVPAPSPAGAASTSAAAKVAVPRPVPSAPGAAETQAASTAVIELVQSLRSMLIAIAGFVASAATGFVVQEFLRRKRGLLFQETAPVADDAVQREERRRRRRAGF